MRVETRKVRHAPKLRFVQTPYFCAVCADGGLDADDLPCFLCGRPLGYSSDDQPDWPTGPMCGDCYQARQMDDEIDWSGMDDGIG